ncbi:hypothetical protein AB4144_43120, partial [Rhizobiaceae sp. 2RAB30]
HSTQNAPVSLLAHQNLTSVRSLARVPPGLSGARASRGLIRALKFDNVPPCSTGLSKGLVMAISIDIQAQAVMRECLSRILAADDFDNLEHSRRLLTYLVDEALSGRSDKIRAADIATAVFGRDPSFDELLDPIVQIVSGRLRRSLARYYLGSGRTEAMRILISKTSYMPVFDCQKAS